MDRNNDDTAGHSSGHEDLPQPQPAGPAEEVFAGRVVSLWQQRLRFPDGKERVYETVRHPGAVAIVALTPVGEVALLRQHRPPADRVLWEIPAGTREAGEAADLCASRELQEETGLVSSSLRHILRFFTTPGFSDELMDLYFAPDAVPHPDGTDLDPTEQLQLHLIPYEETQQMVLRGEIQDAKTLVGLWALSQLGLVAR